MDGSTADVPTLITDKLRFKDILHSTFLFFDQRNWLSFRIRKQANVQNYEEKLKSNKLKRR